MFPSLRCVRTTQARNQCHTCKPCTPGADPVLAFPQGGYNAWFRIFDNKLGRRKSGEYAEQYTHDGDSCGIHSSGAGFARVDSADQYVPPVY